MLTITTRGYIEVYRDGALISRHSVETEAIESALRHAEANGDGTYTLKYPDKTLVSRLGRTAIPFRWNTVAVNFNQGTGASVNLASYLSNPENRAITYTVIGALPTGVTLSGSSLTYNGTAGQATATVQFRASSGNLRAESAASTVAIQAAQVNQPPVWTANTPATLGDYTEGTGGTFSLAQYAYDAEGDPVRFYRTGSVADTAPGSVSVNFTTGLVTVPANAAVGTYDVEVELAPAVWAVSGLSASASYYSALLSWNAATAATSYLIERSTNGTTWTQVGTAVGLSYNDTGLTPQTGYYWRVRGTNGTEFGAYSTIAQGTTLAAPAAGTFEPAITSETLEEPYLTWDGGLDGSTLRTGPNGSGWNSTLGVLWRNANSGDYIGTDGTNDVQQGGNPFASGSITAGAGFKTFDVAALVQRALTTGRNKGWYLRLANTSHSVFFAGRLAATAGNRPALRVVTSAGTFDCLATATAHWRPTITTLSPLDGREQFGVENTRYSIIRFDLSAVAGAVLSATLTLYANTVTGTSPSLRFFEADIPEVVIGGGNAEPRADGLASAYPGDTMASDPSCLMAGHFGGTSVQAAPQTTASKSTTSPSMPGARISYQIGGPVSDPDAPGTSFWRGEVRNVVPGSAGRDPLIVYRRVMYPNLSDAAYPVDRATLLEEAHFRLYVMLEPTWVDTSEGCKFGITWDLRLGKWDTVAGWWDSEGGNSNHISDGRRHVGLCHTPTTNPEWTWTNSTTVDLGGSDYFSHPNYQVNCYKGHMQRQEPSFAVPDGRPYNGCYALKGYNYSNLLFDPTNRQAYDSFSGTGGAFFNTGNIRKPLLRKGRWYCIEQRCKMNTISGPYDSLGNGTADANGELETWVNGIQVDLLPNMQWRCHPDMGIQQAGTVWYIGGNGTTSWPEPWYFRTSHFVFARSYIGPRVRP